jgi:hypothetical protein
MLTNDPEQKESNNNINYEFNTETNPQIFYNKDDILVLDNVLSNVECNSIIKFMDDKKNKVCLNFNDLSQIIEKRCSSLLPMHIFQYDEYLSKDTTHNNNNQYWSYSSINPNWRLVRCNINSKLSKHFDASYVKSVDYKSIYTIMIYLKDSDGDLKFNDNLQFTPKCGRVILFNQSLLHEGLININEIKYFIRSELMFTRDISIETENDLIAMKIYNQAKESKCKLLEDRAFELSSLLERMILNI